MSTIGIWSQAAVGFGIPDTPTEDRSFHEAIPLAKARYAEYRAAKSAETKREGKR